MMKLNVKMDSFSKLAVAALFVVWLLVVLFGVAYVWRSGDQQAMEQLLHLVNTPMSAGLVGYLLKSAFENVRKISLNGRPLLEDVTPPSDEQWSQAAQQLLSGLSDLLVKHSNTPDTLVEKTTVDCD